MDSNKKEYLFEELEVLLFEAEDENPEESLLLRAYARIPAGDSDFSPGDPNP